MPVIANAFTGKVKIDGIYYNLTTKANVAEVSYGDTPYSVEVLTIPSSVEYEGIICNVVSIGTKAFQNCTELRKITIPNSVTEIGDMAFYGCIGLTEVVIPESVISIGGSAYSGCTNMKTLSILGPISSMYTAFDKLSSLESVYIKDLAAWCQVSFWMRRNNPLNYAKHFYVNGVEINDLVIPEGVSVVSDSFWGFQGLKSLTIPEGVTEIAACAFGECYNLTSVSIANTIKKIDYYAFRGCTALKQIFIPNSVTYMGDEVFKGCTNLEQVVIGKGLDYLGPASFSNCTELKDIYVYSEKKPYDYYDNSFSNSDIKYATLYVKESLIQSFKSNLPWKNFGSIVKLPEIIYSVDGEEYKKDVIMVGTPINSIAEPQKEGHTFSGWSEIPAIMPKENVTVSGNFTVNSYILTYKVDDEIYKTEEIKYGSLITPAKEPTKTGYTFSGWSDIPEKMPANNLTITGSFTINKYKLKYVVDGKEFKTLKVEYSSIIKPETIPTKEGHTFSGWSDIPEKMPANDVVVNGSFSVNSYILTYMVDGEIYKTNEINFGSTFIPEESPTKMGYTFSGWSEIPATMPASNVTIYGLFTINKYKLKYIVDGTDYKTVKIEYNSTITAEAAPIKEGYTFSGWGEIPERMPANDLTITGTFTINKYQITYIVDGEKYATDYVEYASKISPPKVKDKEGCTFAWDIYPEKMPAKDITITGTFTTNNYMLTYFVDGEEYKVIELKYKASITPEKEPTKEGYTFSGWSEIPERMPANNVTVSGAFTINKYKITYIIDNEIFTTEYVEYGATIVPPLVKEKEGFTYNGWSDVPETMPANDITIYGSFTTGIDKVLSRDSYRRIYTVTGSQINTLRKGANIILTNSGEIRKVIVK